MIMNIYLKKPYIVIVIATIFVKIKLCDILSFFRNKFTKKMILLKYL